MRKGTHDYYNEHGLDVASWANRRFVALGDANMQLPILVIIFLSDYVAK